MAQSRANRRSPRGARDAARAATGDAPRPDLRRVKGDASRQRILDAAIELFSQRGYAATGVQEIARQAGIEKAALYWHFGSKESLLAAVLDRADTEFVERVFKRVSAARTPDEQLDLFVNRLMRLAAEHGDRVRLMLSIAIERGQVSTESRDAVARVFERTRRAVELGFEQALGVKLPDADLIARLAIAYLEEAAVRGAIDPDHAEHKRFFAHLRRLIVLDIEHQTRTAGIAVPPERMLRRR